LYLAQCSLPAPAPRKWLFWRAFFKLPARTLYKHLI
jgi:hypothetical protein